MKMIVKTFCENDPTFSKKTFSKKMIVKTISLEVKSLLKKMLIVKAISCPSNNELRSVHAVGTFPGFIIPSDVDMALLDASICSLALALRGVERLVVLGLLYVRVYELCLGCFCWLAPCFRIERLACNPVSSERPF